jgi:hypothetical protein
MKSKIKLMALSCAIFLASCSSEPKPTVDTVTIDDDYSYLAVNSVGEINKIGNNTGIITSYSKFNGFNISSFLNLNTVTSNSDNFYLIERLSQDKLFILDKKTKSTSTKTLVYPSELDVSDPALLSLEWNQSKSLLYGILKSNKDNSKSICYLISISPVTLDVVYTGISFNQISSFSTSTNGAKFYSSCYNDNTIEINLDEQIAKATFFNSTNTALSFTRAAMTKNTIMYGMKGLKGVFNGVTLIKLDLLNNTYTDLLPGETYGLDTVSGKGFIDLSNNQYVTVANLNNKAGILKYNISSNSSEFVYIIGGSNMVIVEKIAN